LASSKQRPEVLVNGYTGHTDSVTSAKAANICIAGSRGHDASDIDTKTGQGRRA